jgi:ADP-heptose:LPS heptosyltransferase
VTSQLTIPSADPMTEVSPIFWPPKDTRVKWAGLARMGGVGDNLVAGSVLAPLKRAGYKTEVITQTPYSCVFENNPNIDKLTVKSKDDFAGPDMLQWQQWFANRGKEYELFANLSHSMEHLIAFFPAQTAFWWPVAYRRKIANKSYIETVHDIFGMPHEFGPLFFPTEEEKSGALETKRHVGQRAVAWCVSGSRIDKVYPYAPMAIARIIKELNVPVILLGAPGKDHDLALVVQENVKRTNGSAEGLHVAISTDANNPTWPIRRILSMAGVCDLVIGPDTGPMWSVAFEPMPKILMLSHASAENITKHWVNTVTLQADQNRVPCFPCHQLHDVPATCTPNKENNGAACVSDISVEKILTTIQKIWRR